jgi:SecD/SecF fusion protein
MQRSVKWRLIIIGLVLGFALFNLYPTLKWASLSRNRKAEVTLRWEDERKKFEQDRAWHRLNPDERLADVRAMLKPIKEAYEGEKLKESFWERVNSGEVDSLNEEEKEEFLATCGALTGKDLAADASGDKIKESLAVLRKVRKRLDDSFWKWVQKPKWDALDKKQRDKYREIILELTGERIGRRLSVLRNIRSWFARWLHGDENLAIALGLDLKGGSYFVVNVERPRGVSMPDAVDGAIRVLSYRIDSLGVREPIIQQQGGNKIIVQLPGVTDIKRARRQIEQQASMRWMLVDETRHCARDDRGNLLDPKVARSDLRPPQFPDRRLLSIYTSAVEELRTEMGLGPNEEPPTSDLDRKLAESLPPDTVLRIYKHEERSPDGSRAEKETPLLLQSTPEEPEVLVGDEVTRAQAVRSPDTGKPIITFSLNGKGTKKFSQVTREYNAGPGCRNRIPVPGGEYRGWRLAILLDEKVISAPNIRSEIVGGGQIEGDFTWDEAVDLAIQLKAGALPAKLNILAQNSVGPTLGADSVRKGVSAAIFGLALVVLFMVVYYLLAGVIANLALALNIVIILGVLSFLKATLTLPGIAGIILTIGMAVDANVLIFERIREELAAAKKIAAAIDSGYQKAFRTILDANVTTFISAVVLYYIGTGPVRGFAVTLMIGLATSMFTAIVVTRVVFDLLLRSRRFTNLRMFSIIRNPHLDFIRQKGKAFVLSAVLIVGGMACFAAKWSKNFGIDFSSGQSATLVFERAISPRDLASIRTALFASPEIEDLNLKRVTPQGRDPDTGITVNAKLTGSDSSFSLAEYIKKIFPKNPVVDESQDIIFPTVAHRLWKQAAIALLIAMLGMVIYISWRFEFRFAVGGIVALFHDVLVTVAFMTGFIIFTRRQLNLPIVAALLTIIGYSINDTIVIFDRVREDLKLMKGVDLKTIMNTSINQTLSRTLLTSLTTLLVVVSVFVLAGQAINDFAFAMLVGIITGTYSTIYIASPIVLLMEKKKR